MVTGCSGVNLVRSLGNRGSGDRNFGFHPKQFPIFPQKNFDFPFLVISVFPKNVNYYHLDLYSWIIFPFFLKNLFPTYIFCKIGYYYFSRPVHDLPCDFPATPPTTPSPKSGESRPPTLQD